MFNDHTSDSIAFNVEMIDQLSSAVVRLNGINAETGGLVKLIQTLTARTQALADIATPAVPAE